MVTRSVVVASLVALCACELILPTVVPSSFSGVEELRLGEYRVDTDVAQPPSTEVGFPACTRTAEVDLWNGAERYQSNNNCYNYALNAQSWTRPLHPGERGRVPFYEGNPHYYDPGEVSITCSTVIAAAVADGLFSAADSDCPKGYGLVALVVAPKVLDPRNSSQHVFPPDYHWFRLNGDGSWSHKHGNKKASTRDFMGNVILDPRVAAHLHVPIFSANAFTGHYADYRFCDYLCTRC